MKTANQWNDEAGCGVPHRNFIREIQLDIIDEYVRMLSFKCNCQALAQDGEYCHIHLYHKLIAAKIDEGAKP